MLLYIDTSNNQQTIIKLGDKQIIKTNQNPREQDLLALIKKLLDQQKTPLKTISAIQVNQGPGSFTSLRIGVAVANALGFALNIPVNHQPPGKPVFPHYGKAPNISTPKPKKALL